MDPASDVAEHRPGVVGDEHREIVGGQAKSPRRIGQHRGRAGRHCLRGEVSAVRAGTGQRRIEVAGLDGPRVQRAAGDGPVQHGPVGPEPRDLFEQRRERTRGRVRGSHEMAGGRYSARRRSVGLTAPVGGIRMVRRAKLMMSRKTGPATAPP